MISKKYSQILFMIFMSFGMSVIMSGVVTAVNTSVADGVLKLSKPYYFARLHTINIFHIK